MRAKGLLSGAVLGLILLLGPPHLFAASISVDLTKFTKGPAGAEDAVVIAGPNSATIYEDPSGVYSPVFLKNESFDIPVGALAITFHFRLTVEVDNKDFFDFYIGNPSERVHEWGGFGHSYTSADFTYDIKGLAGQQDVPIIFQLQSGFPDTLTDSWVEISDVEITVIPLPGTLLLLSSGLLGIVGLRRKRYLRS